MTSRDPFDGIEGEELYRKLATGEPVVVLDVRTETEFAARHIPGSILIPLHQLEQRFAEVPNGSTPLAVVCEHGIRSASACRFLSERGYATLYNVVGGMQGWPGPVDRGLLEQFRPDRAIAPARFLVQNFDLLTRGLALDLASGEGRNALYLAARGFDVDAVDADHGAIIRARAKSRRLGAPIRAMVGNVEDGTYILPIDTYDTIAVFNYLHRPLFNDIRSGLKSGGTIVYQTYTTGQLELGHGPSNPDYLLRPGELEQVFRDWDIRHYREYVENEGPGNPPRALAGIVARKT